MAARLRWMLEYLGQLVYQLSQVLTSRGDGLQANGFGYPSEGCLEQMPSGYTLQRIDDGILNMKGSIIPVLVIGVAVSSTQLLEQRSDHSAFPGGFRAMNDTIPTWGSLWLLNPVC